MHIGAIELSSDLFFLAGPCLVEDRDMIHRTAEHLAELAGQLGVHLVLKGSFKKANRTSADSFSTIGEERALELLAEAGRANGLPTVTDVHTAEDAALAARYVDLLQIPAFLCRQTELIQAAARTGKPLNIKKGQFVAPEDMHHAVQKAQAAGTGGVMLCERGTTFGYHNLVVDMRALVTMRESGVPVVYDATHSVQLPSVNGVSGGQPQFVLPLARAAVAVGINGVFFETHPNPALAKSDAASQIPLADSGAFMRQCVDLHRWLGARAADAG